jgi:glutamyl/glutaminyl-tRNA synthetase
MGSHAIFFNSLEFVNRFGPCIKVLDAVFGELNFDLREVIKARKASPDFPLCRQNGSVLWHLTSPVDDEVFGVNYIVRAQDKLSNIPYQEMIRISLGLTEKRYAHVPLLMPSKGVQKFEVVTLHDLMREGFSVAGIVSYLLASGYSSSETIYPTLGHFAKDFNPSLIHRTNGSFDKAVLRKTDQRVLAVLPNDMYLKEIQKIASAFWPLSIAGAVEHNSIVQGFITSWRRPIKSTQKILGELLTPQYSMPKKVSLDNVAACLQKLERLNASCVVPICSQIDLPGIDKSIVYSAVRWIAFGSETGVPADSAIQFLVASSLWSGRLQEARAALTELRHGLLQSTSEDNG